MVTRDTSIISVIVSVGRVIKRSLRKKMGKQKSREELVQSLQELRQGKLSPDEIYHTVASFGRMRFLEARPEVEQLLSHQDAEIRYIALNVLAFDWQLVEHWKTALEVLEHDQEDDNRLQAANVLGMFKMNTRDQLVLRALARVVSNEDDDLFVRKAAYHAMQDVLHAPEPRVHLENTRKPFDPAKDVDWELSW